MVQTFYNEETAYESFLRGGGYVCNNLGMGSSSHRVHVAHCRMLNDAGPARRGHRTSVKKAASRTLADLTSWLTREYGREPHGYRYCAFCRPQDS